MEAVEDSRETEWVSEQLLCEDTSLKSLSNVALANQLQLTER